MAQKPRKSKKWTSLIKDISEKVGFSPRSPATSTSPFAVPPGRDPAAADGAPPALPETASDVSKKLAPEFVFKSSWEKFLSSNSEQEKEMALQTALDIFCKIVKHQHDVNVFVTMLVETHVFSFAIGRAFVANIEKVRISNKMKSFDAANIMDFFSMVTQDGIKHGYNLLSTVEVLVSGAFDKQPLLDSGILSCLVQIMCVVLCHEEINKRQVSVISENFALPEKAQENVTLPMGQFEVEGSIIHIIKALASHPSSATCLIEDDSLKLLSQMVSSGSMNIFSQFKQGLVPLYTIQFYRHSMQILHLLLVNNNGNTAKYIHKHHLVKVLLVAVKDFNPEVDDSVYTIGILDILLECVELSYRPEAGSVRLREDIHNAHGYQLFVHFALKLSLVQSDNIQKSISSIPSSGNSGSFLDHLEYPCPYINPMMFVTTEGMDELSGHLSPSLSRLLDIIVSLAKIGPTKPADSSSEIGSKQNILMEGHNKVYDLDAVQVLQNIFLKSDCVQLQTEVLNRIFKIFLDHLDNYRLCQELRIMPLFIINMPDISPELQGMIFKIVEYVVTVVNCVPEQELLSLCCLLQQPINCNLKGSVLSFFVKILSFDQLYQRVLWEVGLLEVLVDDMQQHKLNSGSDKLNGSPSEFERKFSSKSMKKLLEDKNAILSPRLEGHGFGKILLFEEAGTISIAWECILSLLKKSEANQSSFRSDSGFDIVLPFLASDTHRPGALRLLSCLIIEDNMQVYPGALGALIEILKSGVVTSVFGIQYKVKNDAKCDILGSLWRILGSNNSAKIVFGEATGFSLLLTILHSFQNEEFADAQLIKDCMKVVSFLFHVMVVAVSNNDINRSRLDAILSSQTFSDLLCESRLICLHWEEYIIQFFLELALEIILPPSNELQRRFVPTNTTETRESGTESLSSSGFLGSIKLHTGRVYNAGAVTVLIRSLLLFTPKVQLEILFIVEKLASVGSFNQENLTSKCCVGLLLDIIAPSLTISSPLLIQALRVVEVLGAYKLSMLELRVLVKYILQMKSLNSGHYLVDMMEKLIQKQDIVLENISLAPYVEMNMSKIGHASVQVTLGERTWPPAAGYTFVCWFQYQSLLKNPSSEQQQTKNDVQKGNVKQPNPVQSVLNLFSVGSMDDTSTTYTRIYIQDRGVLTLTMGNSSLSFSDMELEEGKWHHLAVVHSKPNALSGLFQANTAQVYLNGKLQHTGKLGYSPSIVGKSLHATIGTLSTHGKVCKLSWRLRCCYLFEEVLTAGSLCFMYILGRGYRGIFQDTDLLQFVPHHACGGDSMAILESFDAEPVTMSSMKKVDGYVKRKRDSSDGTGVIWDLNRLTNLSLDLIGKKLIFAFDGTSSDARGMFGVPLLLNLVDPTSVAASPVGGIPLIGRLHGDSYICHQCVIGDDIRAIGGIPVVLALVESAETRDMLHMALALLASALHQNPQNVLDMQACRGYHLLAIFLHHKMPLFDMQSLDIFFQIAACEASFQKPSVLQGVKSILSSDRNSETTFPDTSSPNISHEISSVEFEQSSDEYSILEKVNTPFSDFHSAEMPKDTSKCVVISNSDMVEHVLIDWTLWVTAPVSIQLAVLGFLEQMVTMDGYRSHNLTLLREINLVEHLLVILQRDDVDMHVLEKLVVLLGVILDDGFLATELDAVVRFVIMTFDPPLLNEQDIFRETMGKHVTIRNLLLEMLIDLRLTITSEELLEQWHEILSLKFIMVFLDEAIHPSSMRWIMTLLGVWLSSSPTFAHEFHSGGGYQILTHVLPNFCDYLEIYYILFCLILGKPVYPRLPEVIIEDFHALMSGDGCQEEEELTFVELLDSVIAMTKFNFDRVNMQIASAHHTDNIFSLYPAEDTTNTEANILAESPSHAVLQNGNAAAIGTATYVLRFMADLAKMSPSFSSICRRPEFLGSCVDLYFSCVRIECAKKLALGTKAGVAEARSSIANDDCRSTLQMSPGLPEVQEQSSEIGDSVGSFPQGLGTIFEENPEQENVIPVGNVETEEGTLKFETGISSKEDLTANHSFHPEDIEVIEQSQQSTQLGSPCFTRTTPKIVLQPSASPILALTSWLGSRGVSNVLKDEVRKKRRSLSLGDEVNLYPELEIDTEIPSDGDKEMIISPKLLLEVNSLKHEGCKSSTGATEILDFVGVVLADVVLEQSKASQCVENTLEAVPLYIPVDSALVFQGLCLDRMMHFLERRLVRDDEEEREKKLDKSIWSVNLGALCWTIVDHVYMGSFPQPVAVLKVLEFLFSMLELANIDGCIEKATPLGKGLLSMTRANRQLGSHVHALLKSLNRMIMYCFLPSFLTTINEYSFLAYCGFQTMPNRALLRSSQNEPYVDICSVLQTVSAHKQLVFCPSNLDTDLICCLCVNLIYLLRDKRKNARSLAVDIIKYLLLNRRSTLEELLASKPHQGQNLNVLHGGFDQLLRDSSKFFDWLQRSEQTINLVLEQCAALMWEKYILGSSKFPGIRIKAMEGRRKREMERKSRDVSKMDSRYGEHRNRTRNQLKRTRDSMINELRVIRQNKYGWVLHAESEWQSHMQQLIHERGIIPMQNSFLEPEWQLCPIEGPYRMRKKLELCKLKVEMIQNFLNGGLVPKENYPSQRIEERGFIIPESGPDSLNFLSDGQKQSEFNEAEYEELYLDAEYKGETLSSRSGWDGEQCSSVNEASLHSAHDSDEMYGSMKGQPDVGSPRLSSFTEIDSLGVVTETENKLHDNGEYLIRPYLEPLERIRFKYNCERVMGLDKHDGVFLIGDHCLYVIENFYIDDLGCFCEKQNEDELSVIEQALGVKKDVSCSSDIQSKPSSTSGETVKPSVGARAWACDDATWGKKKVHRSGALAHAWNMWKLESISELLKRDYQLQPVAVEIFSTDGCNDLLIFHKKEREDVFKNLVSLNLPRNNMLDNTISGSSKQENAEGSRFFKTMAKSFSKRWQNGEISNFQYLMHLNTLAGRGYGDLTQYPVFPWVLADYESETLDLTNPITFRKLDKPMGCQTEEGEEEFKRRYEIWDDPDVPKFHYGSHYSSSGIVLFYLLRLPPFSNENQKLQGGQFDRADRLFNSVKDTWLSAVGKGNTSDVKELIPEFYYMPEFLENRFNLDLGEKQSGEKVCNVELPPWAKGSAREFIRKHREALECDYISENLHHWIDLIFGYKQRGEAAEEAVNVFYHYTYEGSVDIDSISDPAMKAAILAQINHFGQTPKQLFFKPHVKRNTHMKIPHHPLYYCKKLLPHEVRTSSSSISQIVSFNEKNLVARKNNVLRPVTYSEYIAWGFPDRSLRFISYEQDKILSTHESLHGGHQIQCVGVSHDSQILVTGGDNGSVMVWRICKAGARILQHLMLLKVLCGHIARITCLYVSQPYSLIVTGSDDCSVIVWDLSGLAFVRQLSRFPSPVSAVHVNDLTGEIVTAAGILLSVWSINGDCLATVDTSQLPSDLILSITTATFSDWKDTNLYATGHRSGAIKIWKMVHRTSHDFSSDGNSHEGDLEEIALDGNAPEYRLILQKILKTHKHSVTALHLASDQKQLLSGDSTGCLISWRLPDDDEIT